MNIKSHFFDYLSLTKPRLAMLNIIAAVSGILMTRSKFIPEQHFYSIFLISILIAGAGALNCAWEKEGDKLMARTKDRPLPAGRISVFGAVIFGLFLVLLGLYGLFLHINILTFLLGLLSVVSYVLVYTPLKRKSHYAVYAGAIPGALPPVLGYVSVTNTLDSMALTLFGILFFWQIPHFLAISIYQSEDYAEGGIKVYPNVKNVNVTRNLMIIFSVITAFFGILPYILGKSNIYFLITGSISGIAFIYINSKNISLIKNEKEKLNAWAKKCFVASIIYLPILFSLMIVF